MCWGFFLVYWLFVHFSPRSYDSSISAASSEHFTSVCVCNVCIPCCGSALRGRRTSPFPSFMFAPSLHPPRFSNLYSLEVYPGVYWIQLAVQGVEGGSLGGLGGPAVHHDAVNVLRTAGWTGQPKPRRQQIQHFFVAFSWKEGNKNLKNKLEISFYELHEEEGRWSMM